jgi:hypothetical protein
LPPRPRHARRRFGLERLLRDVIAGQFHLLPEAKQHLFTGRLAAGRDPVTGKVAQTTERAA